MVWPESRTEIEQGFAADLTGAFASVADVNPDAERIESAVAGVAEPWFDTTSRDALAAILLLLDDKFGPDSMLRVKNALNPSRVVSTRAAAQLLGRQVAANSQRMMDQMRSGNMKRDPAALVKTPGAKGGLTPQQFDVVFGRGRAERIAITETTRMAEIAEKAGMEVLRTSGIAVSREWVTESDERVCNICGPLHGLPDHLWPSSFKNGPPAHVRCRCVARIIGLDELLT